MEYWERRERERERESLEQGSLEQDHTLVSNYVPSGTCKSSLSEAFRKPLSVEIWVKIRFWHSVLCYGPMTGYCFAMNGYLSARLPHAATVREVSVKMFSYSPIHSQSPSRPFLCCVSEYLQWTLHWKPTTGIYPVSHFGDSIETNELLRKK